MKGGYERVVDDPCGCLGDPDPEVRRIAVAACAGSGNATAGDVASITAMLTSDPEPVVRAEAAEALGTMGAPVVAELLAATPDPDVRVVEAVATALGELEDPAAVPWLLEAATTAEDRLVREAAVVALGAIGDERALPVLLDLVVSAPPQVRRRTVVALTAFDDPAALTALRHATADRNPMVREVAIMAVGVPPRDGWEPITFGG